MQRYITCSKRRSRPKVSIEVCARCRVRNCPDYHGYCQPTLFPFLVRGERFRSSGKKGKLKPVLHANGPEQLPFVWAD